MLSAKMIVLIDEDERRRARITHRFSDDDLVFSPHDSMDNLLLPTDPGAIWLIHDDGKSVESALERIDGLGVWMPIIAFAESPSLMRVVDVIFAGAMNYLDANFSLSELRDGLAKVAGRAALIRRSREETLRARSNMERLSQREREVISALSEGLTNKRIAQRLNISPRTVEIHRTNALGKMGASNSYEAIRIALESKVLRTN